MGTIVLLVIIGLLGLGAIVGGAADGSTGGKLTALGGAAFLVLGVALTLFFGTYVQIGSGEIGLVKSASGVYQAGVLTPGTHFKSPIDSVDTVDVRTQTTNFTGIQAVSAESQGLSFDVQVQYHLDPNPKSVITLYKSVGPDWYQKFIPGQVQQDVKEQVVKYQTINIAPNRARLASDIEKHLHQDLLAHSIFVENVLLTNFNYSKAFDQSINLKQIAAQNTARAGIEADRLRAQAKGERDAAITRAEGEKKANDTINKSITPRLIEFERVQALDDLAKSGKVIVLPPNTYLGNGAIR